MKTRNGFVSNSSSSSFTCDVCGSTESGRDVTPSDFEMFRCSNGHICCNSHKLESNTTIEYKRQSIINIIQKNTWMSEYDKREKIEKIRRMTDEQVKDACEDFEYEYDMEESPSVCPICNFVQLNDQDALEFLLRKHKTNRKLVLAEMRNRFTTYADFQKFTK